MLGWVVSIWVGSECWILECGWVNLSGRLNEWVGWRERQTETETGRQTETMREG